MITCLSNANGIQPINEKGAHRVMTTLDAAGCAINMGLPADLMREDVKYNAQCRGENDNYEFYGITRNWNKRIYIKKNTHNSFWTPYFFTERQNLIWVMKNGWLHCIQMGRQFICKN